MVLNEMSFEKMKKPAISGLYTDNSLEKLGQGKRDSLKNSIIEIQKLVNEREELSENFLEEGDEIQLEISNFLLENEKASKNINEKDFLAEKNSLRNKKIEISELQLNEKINCWKDVALLKKEMRQYEKELFEKESRFNGINEILSEDN